MARGNCLVVNPAWHPGHSKVLRFPEGPVVVVCEDCLTVVTVADTYETSAESHAASSRAQAGHATVQR